MLADKGSIMFYAKWRTKHAINRWRKALNIEQHKKVFHEIFDPVDGFSLSRKARTQNDALEYVYGEIEFESFIAVLSLAKLDSNTIFYDLGSGTGKAVIACAMVFNPSKSVGVELFSVLHASASEQHDKLKRQPDYARNANKLTFIHDDFLKTNLAEATLIFINATGLFGTTWNQLNQRLDGLSGRPTIITTSKKLLAKNYTLRHTTTAKMSWGVVDIYYHD